jgi:hypothetical protein
LASELANDSKVVLIAHSMGGLVASAYLAKGQSYRDKVEKLITFGTPYTGAAKAIGVFETGELMGWLSNLVMATHVKELSANTTSTYELLPTSRYGDSYLGLTSSSVWEPTYYGHSAARAFLATRTWAKKANGTVKPMLADGETFHNSLMIGSSHVAEYFGKSYYIVGTGRATPYQAFYTSDSNNQYLGYYEPSIGDGTVISQSARNNRVSGYYSVSSEHTDLVSDAAALDYMKNLIRGTAYSAALAITNNDVVDNQRIEIEEDAIDCISVVIQGAQGLTLADADGNELIQDNGKIYRLNSDGSSTEIGCIWLIDIDRQRYQYVLEPGEYQFEDIELNPSIPAEVLIMSFENDQYTSKIKYDNIAPDEIQIDVSFGEGMLIEKATMDEILPSKVATPQEIQEINASRGLSN